MWLKILCAIGVGVATFIIVTLVRMCWKAPRPLDGHEWSRWIDDGNDQFRRCKYCGRKQWR